MSEQVYSEFGVTYQHEKFEKQVTRGSDGRFYVAGTVGPNHRRFEAGPFDTLEEAMDDSSEEGRQ